MKFSSIPSIVLFLLCLLSTALSAQWIRQYPLPKLEDVLDMDVSEDGYGFAAGTNDLLLRLDPETEEWTLLPGFGEGWRFEAVDYLDNSGGNIAVAGGDGLILTTNKGVDWNEIPGAPAGINSIKLFSPTHLMAISDEGVFEWENDQWTDLEVPALAGLKGGFILNTHIMWAYTFATNPAIYYTINGGDSWQINLDIEDVDVLRFFDSFNGIATDGRKVYSSNNGGVSWTLVSNNAIHNSSTDIAFGSSPMVLMAATFNASPAYSTDGGLTWVEQNTTFINMRNFSIVGLSDDEFWVGNDLSSIVHTTDHGDHWEETSGPERNIIQDVFFLTRNTGFAIGQSGQFLRSFDGGATWEDLSFGARSHFTIHGTDETDLWIGTNQRILHSADTGRTWIEKGIFSGGNINTIHAINENVILAGSSAGVIYKSTNAGADWDTVHMVTTAIRSIAPIDDQHYMATGFGGVILRSDNQGTTWSVVAPPEAGLQYEEAYFLDGEGWLITSSFKKTMWHTSNNGATWEPITLPIERFWDGVFFMTPDTGIIIGRSNAEGRAYITYTGGQTWTAAHITPFPLYGVTGFPNPNGTAWIHGFGSDIERLSFCLFPGIAEFAGDLFPCEADTVGYSVQGTNVDEYQWIFPPEWQIIGNDHSDTITVIPGPHSGFISVSGSNNCGTSSPMTFSAGPDPLPVIGDITGENFPCEGEVVTYNVTEINADHLEWHLQPGWSIQGDPNQSSISVLTNNNTGFIYVVGSNICGRDTSSDFFVAPEPLPDLTFISGDVTPCPGDTVQYEFITGLGTALNVFWNSGLNDWMTFGPGFLSFIAGHDAGSLTVFASSDCGASDPYLLELDPVDVSPVDIMYLDPELQLAFNGTATSYQWFYNGELIPGANEATYVPAQSGDYQAAVTFSTGCTVLTASLQIIIISVHNPVYAAVEVYPVPATDKLYIKDLAGKYSYVISDATGRIVSRGISTEQVLEIDQLLPGYYSLHLKQGDTRYVARFVVD